MESMKADFSTKKTQNDSVIEKDWEHTAYLEVQCSLILTYERF